MLAGKLRSTIQITTASSLRATLDLLVESASAPAGTRGTLPHTGFVRQEEGPPAALLANRFGRVNAAETLVHAASLGLSHTHQVIL